MNDFNDCFFTTGHSESFQILKYDLGQKYNAHLDFSGSFTGDQACGPRILTFFLYLSDVEEGGETAFPLLDLAVKPQKGKAVLWPSVHDDDLEMPEQLSLHEARPVIKGTRSLHPRTHFINASNQCILSMHLINTPYRTPD